MFMDKLRAMHESDPLAFEVYVRRVASMIEDQSREEDRTDPRENPAAPMFREITSQSPLHTQCCSSLLSSRASHSSTTAAGDLRSKPVSASTRRSRYARVCG